MRRFRNLRRRYGRMTQIDLPFNPSVTDVLGETRQIEKVWPSGEYECPFCHYPAKSVATGCQNPACSASEHAISHADQTRPVFEKHRQAAEERKAEESRRQRDREWYERNREDQRLEREKKTNDIVEQARAKGACVRCALKSAPYRVKFIKHRGKCPLGR